MPEGLTQTKTPTVSETRPEIDRNGGRLHFGMAASFKSERWPASHRNTRPELIGIRTLSAQSVSRRVLEFECGEYGPAANSRELFMPALNCSLDQRSNHPQEGLLFR